MKRVRHDETVPQFTKFRRSAKLGALVTTFCMFFMLGSPAQANPEESFVDMLNALQKALAVQGSFHRAMALVMMGREMEMLVVRVLLPRNIGSLM